MGQIYLIHFDKPYKHAQHYLGYVNGNTRKSLTKRYNRHKSGDGAKLLKVLILNSIDFTIVRTWKGVTRNDERILKNRTCSKYMCPVCNINYKRYGNLTTKRKIT